MSIVTRFPPSPTGFMHIGTARTALFNWLYARRHGGKMLFRIEDTDRARHSEAAVIALIKAMKWLEMDWDGEIVSQFEQRARHKEVALEMLKNGRAYYCYCSPEELESMRTAAKAEGRNAFYDRRWRDRDPAEAPSDIKPVIRIKAPLEGESTILDHVQGSVTVQNDHLDDFILLRSDGTPTYMLSVVVDDHDMGVTHVIRGDDHLNNAFRQNIIYDAMGWKTPEYAHLPLILGADGSKMSKRHGAASVEEYRDMGYLPEAVKNYLLRLGWSHGDDEIISQAQAIAWFNLESIGKSPARFDFEKLESINAHYIKEADSERLISLCESFYLERHNVTLDQLAQERIMKGADELKSRARTLLQFTDESVFYTKKVPLALDEKAAALLDHEAIMMLKELLSRLQSLEQFTGAEIQTLCKAVADEQYGGKLGNVAMPFRAALTGTTVSPSIFHAAEILGKAEVCLRLASVIERT
ncbi:MAG: glutamate--tRNA ligase [Alphaproteobacteria bacterium]|nr:glutamate--tRNA ligase [Alphaproteobacteria bacterium]